MVRVAEERGIKFYVSLQSHCVLGIDIKPQRYRVSEAESGEELPYLTIH